VPILEEIAAMLSRNANWTLSIAGHTDNVGGDATADLSRRRSEAVRSTRGRYGIASPHWRGRWRRRAEGHQRHARRARLNRRVELVRQ
jgi:outer membrane protein OmpA-like peptidoglycan-associated protein